ncbi:taste receptor type 2 member 40-like [Rhinoderma darwinii]|uniref:taste receptor type 2 member 40-like n=1 Tax=Rhinoderma darwinii TaxID=43563 RepID=UPI003F67A98F
MRLALKIVRFIVMVITGVCGTFLNSIIVLLNFRFWRDNATSETHNKILFLIGLVNILLQATLIVDTIFETFYSYLLDKNFLLFLFSLEFTLIEVNIWNTTWLSIFCCVRLVNFSHWFLLKIKAKFFAFFPQLIIGSVLVSTAMNLPLYWTTTLDIPHNVTYCTTSGRRFIVNYYYIICSSLFGFSVPFSMTCVSIGLSVTTLLRHMWRMGGRDSHLTSAQLQGHSRAVRTMVIRVILDIIFSIVTVIGTSVSVILNSPVYSVLWIIVLTYPTSQSLILIFGNPKLKSAVYGFLKVLR